MKNSHWIFDKSRISTCRVKKYNSLRFVLRSVTSRAETQVVFSERDAHDSQGAVDIADVYDAEDIRHRIRLT